MFTSVLLPPLAETSGIAWVWRLVSAGGAPGLVIVGVLVVLSLAALALVIEHALMLRLSVLAPEGLAQELGKRLAAADGEGAAGACLAEPCFLAKVVSAGLLETESGWPAVEKAMEDAADEQAARLLRRIDYLSVIGNLAPMLGLLGTVIGMIIAFGEVAETEGAATAAELAGGIYQALVTTVAGLLVAIPSLGAYAVLRNRVDRVTAEVIEQAEAAARPLKRMLLMQQK